MVVTWGIVMAVLFSAAAAYLGLKVGQVFEAAIPIAIIAVGVSVPPKQERVRRERHHPVYRCLVLASSWQVPSSPFPALYILAGKLSERQHFFADVLSAHCWEVLGILFLSPSVNISSATCTAISLPRSHSHHTSARLR